MKTEKVYTQHDENKEWASTLSFFKDESKIMEGRLGEIASKNTSKDILARVEQFQNKLIIAKDTIALLNHKINLSEDEIHESVNSNMVAVDHRKIKDHTDIRNEIKLFQNS